MYYEILPDGTIGRSTQDAIVAQSLGLTLQTEQKIVYAHDGKRYFLGQEPSPPEKPQAEINQERINELQAYLTSTDWYAVRMAETGVAIPNDVVTARASAREEISTLRDGVELVI